MQLPKQSNSAGEKRRFAKFVIRRLKRAKHDDLAKPVETATKKVRALEIAADEALDPVQDAAADADASNDAIDDLASDANLKHRSEGVGIDKTPVFRKVWEGTTEYFIAAPVDEQGARAVELADRFDKHLPAGHLLRKTHGPKLRAGAKQYDADRAVLKKARSVAALAADELDLAESDLLTLLERTYGALVAREGKAKAERYFPRRSSAPKGPAKPDEDAPA